MLAEAGYPDGVEITIDVGNTDGPWQQTVCEIMRDQLQEIGIKLNINVMPASKYWEIWDKTPFGATSWTHRPLGTMVLSLGYRTGVPWNESGYSNPEFDKALDEAEAMLDVEERKAQDGGGREDPAGRCRDDAAGLAPGLHHDHRAGHGYPPHPTQYHQFNKVWLEQA